MQRNAFKMKLKPGFKEEYKKRHDEIWPELEKALTEAGIQDYSIFLDEETLTLFAVQKLEDNFDGEKLRALPIMKKWWDYMKDIMEVNPDNSPLEVPLEEVFYMN
ncbi:MAG: L-rhamnose mutarotase [Balneolaceae bacterium]